MNCRDCRLAINCPKAKHIENYRFECECNESKPILNYTSDIIEEIFSKVLAATVNVDSNIFASLVRLNDEYKEELENGTIPNELHRLETIR